MEIEIIKGTVEIPDIVKPGSGPKPSNPVTLALVDWLGTDNKTLKFKFKTTGESRHAYVVLYSYRKNRKLDFTIYKRGVELYCIKA